MEKKKKHYSPLEVNKFKQTFMSVESGSKKAMSLPSVNKYTVILIISAVFFAAAIGFWGYVTFMLK